MIKKITFSLSDEAYKKLELARVSYILENNITISMSNFIKKLINNIDQNKLFINVKKIEEVIECKK